MLLYPDRRKATVGVNCRGVLPLPPGAKARLELATPGGPALQTIPAAARRRSAAAGFHARSGRLARGEYEVRAVLCDAADKIIAQKSRAIPLAACAGWGKGAQPGREDSAAVALPAGTARLSPCRRMPTAGLRCRPAGNAFPSCPSSPIPTAVSTCWAAPRPRTTRARPRGSRPSRRPLPRRTGLSPRASTMPSRAGSRCSPAGWSSTTRSPTRRPSRWGFSCATASRPRPARSRTCTWPAAAARAI